MRKTFQSSIKDRAFLTPLVIGGLLLIILFMVGAAYIRYSEIQVDVRYTGFSLTKFYKEQWHYQFLFMFYGVIVYAFHLFLGLKLFRVKGRQFAIGFQWLTVAMLVISLFTIWTLFWAFDKV